MRSSSEHNVGQPRRDRAQPDDRNPCTKRSTGRGHRQRCRASSAGRAEISLRRSVAQSIPLRPRPAQHFGRYRQTCLGMIVNAIGPTLHRFGQSRAARIRHHTKKLIGGPHVTGREVPHDPDPFNALAGPPCVLNRGVYLSPPPPRPKPLEATRPGA